MFLDMGVIFEKFVFRFFKNIIRKLCASKFIKESWTTHQNSVLSPLRILKNYSSCSFPPWGWSQSIFRMDKLCLKIKTCAKMTLKKHDFWQEVYGNFEIRIYLTRSVWKFRNQDLSTKDVIYSLPRAPFRKKKCSNNHETYENS